MDYQYTITFSLNEMMVLKAALRKAMDAKLEQSLIFQGDSECKDIYKEIISEYREIKSLLWYVSDHHEISEVQD